MLVILPALNPGAAEYEDSFLWFVGMLVLVVGLTEVTQFVLMRAFGARARLRPKWSAGLGPVLVSWWTAEGHGFTAKQYALLGSVPTLLTLATGAAFVALTPVGAASGAYLLLVYGLVQFKNLWLALIALRQPDGTLFEERMDGTRIYRPSSRPA